MTNKVIHQFMELEMAHGLLKLPLTRRKAHKNGWSLAIMATTSLND